MEGKDIYILLVFALLSPGDALARVTDDALARVTDDALLARLTPERGLFATASCIGSYL
jgi:hypothetical protein